MSNYNSNLFELVKSLTRGEKKAVSLRLGMTKGKKNHAVLFDILNKINNYNEEIIVKSLDYENIKTPLPRLKIYLQEFILSSLREIYEKDDKKGKVRNLIMDANICHKKGLRFLRNKKLKKALDIAEDNEFYELHLDILNMQWDYKFSYQEGHLIIGKYKKVIDRVETSIKFREIMFNALEFEKSELIRSNLIKKKWDTIFCLAEMQKEPKGKEESYFYNQLYIDYYFISYDFEKMLPHLKKMVSIIESSEKLQSNPSYYYSCLSNYILVLAATNNLKEAKLILNKLLLINRSELNKYNKQIINHYILAAYSNIINSYIKTKEFHEGSKLIDEILDYLKTEYLDLSINFKIPLYLTITNLYVCLKDYKRALYWNNLQLNNNPERHTKDAFGLAKIMNLIIHYELGNFDLIPYLVRSTYRYLRKLHSPNSFELIILDFIKNRLLNMKDKKELTSHLLELKNTLDSFYNNTYEARILDKIDLITWINYKLCN